MLTRLAARPLVLALAIGAAAELLFAWQLGRPGRLVFDEVHYVPAARALLALSGPINIEHPPLGKELIALSMMLFGDDPIGWRALSTLAGSATVAGMFALLRLAGARAETAALAALQAMLNQMVFVQARIAMLDGFMAAFLIWGLASIAWAMRASPRWVGRRWAAGGALLGLATAAKWAAVPYFGFAMLGYRLARRRDPGLWPGLGTWPALLILGAAGFAAYALTFLPACFYAHDPLTLAGFVPLQFDMVRLQAFKLPAHRYQSQWWSWPLMLRPIWYFYAPDMGAERGVLLIGNPIEMWGGLVAVLACYRAGSRDRAALPLAAALLWTAALGVWALTPKSLGFFYYYYLPGLFLCPTIAIAFEHHRARRSAILFLAASALMFAYFYPVLSGAPLGGPDAFTRWAWFRSWI